jgi:hypothetical protein
LNSTFNASFLEAFAAARVADVQYLQDNGLKVPWWGLQNEPNFDKDNITAANCSSQRLNLSNIQSQPLALTSGYSTCYYSQCDYYRTFKVVAPVMKTAFPDILIHSNSARGQAGSSPIANDVNTRALVDLWTWHFVGASGTTPMTQDLTAGSYGIPVANNEYEYQPNSEYAGTPIGFLNTAHMIMNFLVFANSPTFYWIHALKPTTNLESKGYGLGYWRPPSDTNYSHFPTVKTGEWAYNPINANAVLPFAKMLPWNSVRYAVTEDTVRSDSRIFAFKTPASSSNNGPLHHTTPGDRFGLMMAHGKHATTAFTYNVSFDDGQDHVLNGYLFTPNASGYNISLGQVTVPARKSVGFQLAPLTMQVWLEW